MKWAFAISELTPWHSAIQECYTQVEQQGNDISPQPAVIFVSYHHESQYDQAVELVREYDPSRTDLSEIVGLVERARAHVLVVWPPERSQSQHR